MNRLMFWTGIALVAIAVVLFLTSTEDVGGMWVGFLGAVGIVLMGASMYRPLSRKEAYTATA